MTTHCFRLGERIIVTEASACVCTASYTCSRGGHPLQPDSHRGNATRLAGGAAPKGQGACEELLTQGRALNHCPQVLAKERGKSPLQHGGVPLQPVLTPSWLAPLVAMWRCHIPACQVVFWKASSQPSLRVWVTDLHKEVIHSLQIYCQFCYA